MRGIGRLRKKATRLLDIMAHRVDQAMLLEAFREAGLEKGVTVCVHSSLSRLGHVVGGAHAVIEALMETVGNSGTILMPSFAMSGSMASFLDEGRPFDVRFSASRVGELTEAFRQLPSVRRSLHPTHSVAAWGKDVEGMLRHHENSVTPFGHNTPYGRLAARDDAFILMLETHIHSLQHHLQERVNFPNLFLPEDREVGFLDETGRERRLRTKVMRPEIPYLVAVPSANGPAPDWALLQDYTLIFPQRRLRELDRMGYCFEGFKDLYKRRNQLEQSGIFRGIRIGKGEIGLLHAKKYIHFVEPELCELVSRFRDAYCLDSMESISRRIR